MQTKNSLMIAAFTIPLINALLVTFVQNDFEMPLYYGVSLVAYDIRHMFIRLSKKMVFFLYARHCLFDDVGNMSQRISSVNE